MDLQDTPRCRRRVDRGRRKEKEMQTRAWLQAEIKKLLIEKERGVQKIKKEKREIDLKEEKIGSF